MNQKRRAKIQIDLAALRHNAHVAKKMANDASVMSAIKANAYGHGIIEAANALQNVVEEFAVASIDDVLNLRKNSPESSHVPITVLSGFYTVAEIALAIEHKASLVVYDAHQIKMLLSHDFIETHEPVNVWFKVDSGMSRLGLAISQFDEYIDALESNKQIHIRGIMSHFANADNQEHELNQQQFDTFEQLKKRYIQKPWQWTLANSAAILSLPQTTFDWVRPGIMLYGSSPFSESNAVDFDLKPVMTFSSEIISTRQVQKGQSIGYGSIWTAKKDTQVGVVACGYGDGYPRGIQAGTPVLVDGKRTVILGRVSMDLIVLDVSDILVKVGSEVIFWGKGLPIDEIAESANTISYELLCNVTARVEREYINVVDMNNPQISK